MHDMLPLFARQSYNSAAFLEFYFHSQANSLRAIALLPPSIGKSDNACTDQTSKRIFIVS